MERRIPQAKYFNAFNLVDGVGPAAIRTLLAYFSSLEDAWTASASDLKQAGLHNHVVRAIQKQKPGIDPDREMEKIERAGVKLTTLQDSDYPASLKEIYSPPAVLYMRGHLPRKKNRICLGIVGTRKLSNYGRQVTPPITADLSRMGLTIVSGLAKGIDTLTHQAAIEAGGETIAVLGASVEREKIYPPANRRLAEEITEHGTLVSEFPLGTGPDARHFPLRNRIISGLSLGVLVIEAPEKSGALITARDALEQNREVFAVPGHILSCNSLGPHNLIKMGAKLVTKASDIAEELNLDTKFSSNTITAKPANREEALILNELSGQPTHIDKIIIQTKLPTPIVNSTLTLMEIKGKVNNVGNNCYVIAQRKYL